MGGKNEITGRDGGAAFLLIYVLAVLLLGIPMMIAEFSIGRSAHRNVVDAYRKAAPGTKWHWVGGLGLLVAVLILGFYTVLSGWTLRYTFVSLTGDLHGGEFLGFVSDTYQPLFWTLLAIFINASILLGGVQKGIERASNIMMPLLALLLLVLVANSATLDGFGEGVAFLFVPKWEDVTVQTFLDAIGQAFFSLSVAMGILVAYGSYLGDNTKIGKTANANGLKTEEYGITVLDKSPYSAKQVATFRYNQKGVEKLAELLGVSFDIKSA